MSLLTWIADFKSVTAQLARIADALDRAFPIPTEQPAIEPEFSYASDEATATEDMKEGLRRLGLMLEEDKEAESTVPES